MDDFERTKLNTEQAKAVQQEDLEAATAAALDEEPDFKYSYYGNGYECMLLGVTTVIGGQLYGWNAGFSSGFGSYFVGQVMVGLAYIVLLSCLGEMAGTLAFPGGTYGLARVVLGFFPGFMVGCFECCEYVFMSTASVVYIGELFVSFLNCDPNLQPALWFIFYGFTILTTCFDARVFWATSSAIAIVSLVLMMIYSLGSLQYVNLAVNGPYFNNTATYVNTSTLSNFNMTDNTLTTRVVYISGQNYTQVLMTPLPSGPTGDASYWFVGGFSAWLSGLQYCTWGFAGIESLTLMTSMTKDPKQAISFGCSYGVIALFCTCILTVVVCAAMPPGLFVTSGLPTFMSVGYMMMFPSLSYVATLAMILPGQVGMAWGFIVPTGKLLSSLATSNLLPSFFMLRGAKSPRKGIIIGCIIGYIICLIGFVYPSFSAALQPIAIASSNLCYFSTLWAFYKLRTTFGMLPREYKSPYGLIGAGFCCCVFVLVFVSTVFFQGDPDYTCLISMIGITMILFLYYMCFAKHSQTFSKDEQKTVFRLHVIVFNMRKMRNATRPNYTSPLAKVINYVLNTPVCKRVHGFYVMAKKKAGYVDHVNNRVKRRVKKAKKAVDDRMKSAIVSGKERVRSASLSVIRTVNSSQTLSYLGNSKRSADGSNRSSEDNLSNKSLDNVLAIPRPRSKDSLNSECSSEYVDEDVVPMNIVDMTNGGNDVDNDITNGINNRASFPRELNTIISNVKKNIRKSFGGSLEADSRTVVPTDDTPKVTTAQKMEILESQQQQQQHRLSLVRSQRMSRRESSGMPTSPTSPTHANTHLDSSGHALSVDLLEDIEDVVAVDTSMPSTPIRRMTMQLIPSNQESKEEKGNKEG